MPKRFSLSQKLTVQQTLLFCTSILLLIVTSVFLLYHVNYSLGYEGDDYIQTMTLFYHRDLKSFFSIYATQHYSSFVAGREYLRYFYYCFFYLCNGSLETCRIIFISLFVASAFLLFFCLRRRLSEVASTIGALFYLTYFGKYHAIIAYTTEAYIFDLLIFIVIIGILLSDTRLLIQSILVSFLLWISLHFYEVLMVTLPIYPLFWLTLQYIKKDKIDWRSLVYSTFPFIVVGIHIFLLSLVSRPVWTRSLGDPNYVKLSILKRLLIALHNGFTTVLGGQHTYVLKHLVRNFFNIDIVEQPFLIIILLILAGLAIFFIWLNYKQEKILPISNKTSRYALLFIIAGAYLALFGPIMASVIGLDMPSRMTFLPSLGVAMFLAGLVDACYCYHRTRQVLITVFLSVSIAEAIAFCDIFRQAQSAEQYDRSVINKMLSLKNVKIENGASVFLSLPRHPKSLKKYWIWGEPGHPPCMEFKDDAVAWIWRAYHLPIDTIKYAAAPRYPKESIEPGVNKWFQQNRHAAPSKLYPFVITDNGEIKAITKIKIVNNSDSIKEIISTALDKKVTADQSITITFKE